MTKQNELLGHILSDNFFRKRVLQGAGIALVLMMLFLFFIFGIAGVVSGKNWGQALWEFFPLLTVTLGGASGGFIYYLLVHVWSPSGWKKGLAIGLSIVIYIAITYCCLIIGFSATGHWD